MSRLLVFLDEEVLALRDDHQQVRVIYIIHIIYIISIYILYVESSGLPRRGGARLRDDHQQVRVIYYIYI